MFNNEKDFKEIVDRLDIDTKPNDAHRDNLRRQMLSAFNESQQKKLQHANSRQIVWRIIMKSRITKFATAAVIVIAVLIAMNQLVVSTGSVAWGEVVQNIEASPGFIFQLKQIYHRETGTIEINSKVYGSAKYGMRMDGYLDSEVTIQTYVTLSDGVMTLVDHPNRTYSRRVLPDDARAEIESMDPKEAVREFLSDGYTKLGRKTIEGVEAEGIEIDRPSESRANSQVVIQLWVAVDTGLPVLVEVDTVGKDGTLEVHSVQDNFQWNVELDASEFEPDIPEDYTLMEAEIDADGEASFKTTEKRDSQEVVGTKIRKWRFVDKHPEHGYNLESEGGQTVTTIPESWADSPEHAVRIQEELDLLQKQDNRELVEVREIEANGQLDFRILMYEYNLSDGQTIKTPDFDPDDPSQWTVIGERQEELTQLLRERRRQEEKGQKLATTEERHVYGRVFTFKKRRFVLSDGTEVTWSFGTLKDDQ